MLQLSRYIIETNIERFEEHLRNGLLDAAQTRTVTALLAEAREELAEFDRRSVIPHQPTPAQGLEPTRVHPA